MIYFNKQNFHYPLEETRNNVLQEVDHKNILSMSSPVQWKSGFTIKPQRYYFSQKNFLSSTKKFNNILFKIMNIFKLVPCMSHVRCIVHCRPTTVPKHSSAFLWYKHILACRNKSINENIQSLTSNRFYL